MNVAPSIRQGNDWTERSGSHRSVLVRIHQVSKPLCVPVSAALANARSLFVESIDTYTAACSDLRDQSVFYLATFVWKCRNTTATIILVVVCT